MRRVRWRGLVSAVCMVVDLTLLFAFVGIVELPVAVADTVAVGVASICSWLLHRSTTFALDPDVRWVRMPGAFALVAVIAGAVDVAITSLLAIDAPLLPAKLVGVGIAGVVRIVAYRGVLASDTRRSLGARGEPLPVIDADRLTIVVPAKDEEQRIGTTVGRLLSELADLGPDVLVVDDGSSDDTAGAAERAGARVVRHEVNRGKGAAVRSGVAAAGGRTVAFLDADLAYPPAQVRPLLAAVEDGWDVAVGDRFHPRSVVEGRTRLRFVAGRLFNLLTATVLLGQYRDTQCGCKAFRSDVAASLFGRARLDGFAFDVEVLHLVERDRLSLVEVPVTLAETGPSTVRLVRATLDMLRDLLRVRRWSAEGVYDRKPA